MPELNERDTKLVQYLNEAYGKEKELETALQAHIGMTNRAPYRKRLRKHLTETRAHAREVQRRIKKLGGSPASATATGQSAAAKALATAKGPLQMVRGLSEEEKLLKNAKTEYSEEAEEIATYTAIEAAAESVGDRETAKVARSIRRDEERMAKYLERLIPQLSKAVVRTEVPSDQRGSRNGRRSPQRGSAKRKSSRKGSSRKRTSARRSASGKRTSARRSSPRGSSKRRTGARSGGRR